MTKKRRPKTATTRKRFQSYTSVLVLLSCFFLLTTNAASEDHKNPKPVKTALIFGTVWGPNDRPLPGIVVKIRRGGEKKARWQVRSNHRGEFDQEVPSGKQDYVLWAETKGVKLLNGRHLQPSPEVTVHIESNERADTGLHLQ
jgi:hypothetical protein